MPASYKEGYVKSQAETPRHADGGGEEREWGEGRGEQRRTAYHH